MKKIFNLIVLSIIGIGLVFTNKGVNVEGYTAEKTTTDILFDAGFSLNDIEHLSEYTKNSIAFQIENNKDFSFDIITMNELQDGEFSSTINGISIQPMGQIPEADLTLIITTSINKVENNMMTEMNVKLYYDWNNLPLWRLEDPIFISWDESKFEFKGSSFYREDRYLRDGDNLHVSGNTYYEKNNNTLCWYADLKAGNFLGIGGTISKLYGFGEFILMAKNPTISGNTSIDTTYVHSIITKETRVSIFEDVGFFVPGSGNDKISKSLFYYWNIPYLITSPDYGYEQQYFFHELSKTITKENFSFNTKRLRTGFIEGEYIVMSPRRSGAGIAYLEYQFNLPIKEVVVELTLWSDSENLFTGSTARIDYKNSEGNWIKILDLLNDINLSKNRNYPDKYYIQFPEGVTEFRFYATSSPTGDKNKGRICIGDMLVYTYSK